MLNYECEKYFDHFQLKQNNIIFNLYFKNNALTTTKYFKIFVKIVITVKNCKEL